MKKYTFLLIAIFCLQISFAQKSKTYTDSIKVFQKNYVTSHEVVKGTDRKFFRFFEADKTYAVKCTFEKSADTTVVVMKTSGKKIPQKDFWIILLFDYFLAWITDYISPAPAVFCE